MKNLLKIGFGLLVSLTLCFSASASEMLRLGDAIVTYQSGFIDPQNLNGEARDVTITGDDGSVVSFDQYRFKTTPEGGQTRVEYLEMKGMVITEDQDVITIQDFNWTDIVLPVAEFNVNALMFDENFLDQIENFGQFSVDNLDYFENGQQNLHIDQIAFNSAMVDVPNLPDIPIQDVQIDLKNMVVAVDASQDPEFLDMMDQLNLDQFVMNISASSVVEVQPDRVDNNFITAVELKGMGQVELEIGIGMLNSSLQILNAAVTQPGAEISDELVGLMFSGGLFNNMRFMVQDQGLLNLFLDEYARDENISRAEGINMLMDQLAINLGSFAPLTFAKVAPDVRGFLENGGTLTLALDPPSPTVFSSFLGFAAVPDTAAEALGLTVDHQLP